MKRLARTPDFTQFLKVLRCDGNRLTALGGLDVNVIYQSDGGDVFA